MLSTNSQVVNIINMSLPQLPDVPILQNLGGEGGAVGVEEQDGTRIGRSSSFRGLAAHSNSDNQNSER